MRRSRNCLLVVLLAGLAQAAEPTPATLPPPVTPAVATTTAPVDPGWTRFANPGFPGAEVHAVPLDRGPEFSRADLAPYFAEGALARAREALQVGNARKARELLEGQGDAPPVRYLRALAAFRAQDLAFSAPEFDALATAYPALRDRCLVHAGWSYEGLKDFENAARVFAQVDERSRMLVDARLGLSRARRNLKDVKGSLESLQPMIDRPAPPWGRDTGAEALLAQADLLAFKGDKKGEKAALVALWARHPMTKEAARAEARLGEVADLPKDALVTHADALIDAHRNERGLALLEPLLDGFKLPDALACKAHFAAGKAMRKLRQHARAVAVLQPVVKKCKDPDLRARALYTLGFSAGVAAPAIAGSTWETLAHDYPEHAWADDALYYAADIASRRGDLDAANAHLVELVDRYTDGDFTADALFRLFWVNRKVAPAEAAQYLEEIEGRFRASEDTYEVERARYWRARIAEATAHPDDAQALWTGIAREHPTTYYGLLSREHAAAADAGVAGELLADVASGDAKLDPFPLHAGHLAEDLQFKSAVELLRLGFGELVPMEVLAIDRTRLPPEGLRLLVHLLALSGEVRAAHGMARLWLRRELSGPVTKENRATWEVAYPLVFRDSVLARTDEADGLDPDLLQALMREESALDPSALSWAGAMGLCQLMPATAGDVARELRLKSPSTASLLDPDLNIQLGSRYLADLLIRAKGIKQYALAGYNAGEGSVAKWKREDPDAALDEWVENIPVQETRGYVKRVLRSYNTYKLLYAPGEPPQTVGLPPVRKPKPGKGSKKS